MTHVQTVQHHPASEQQNRVVLTVGGVELDFTQVYSFERLLAEVHTVTVYTAPVFIRDFLVARAIVINLHGKAVEAYELARAERKRAFARAKLYDAPLWLESQKRKPTEDATTQFAELDPKYQQAVEDEAKLRAAIEMLKPKIDLFKDAHDSVKKMFDKQQDPRGSSSSAPSHPDAQ